ncbi:hypothetical protein ACQ4PT_061498 [Festuca glaucescens]
MVVQTCHAIHAMRSDEKPDIRMVSNAGVALAGSTLMNQQDGNNINILRTSVEEPADDCSAETVEVTHLNNGVGESISHIRVRTPDRAGLVSTVGSISKSWQSSNVAHNDARDACGSGSRVLGLEESRGNCDAPPFDVEMVTAEPTEEESEMDNMFKGEYPAVEQICEAGTPEEGMQFDSRESAFQYFALFARRIGFAIRKYTSLNSRRTNTMIKQVFVCTKQGHTHVSDKVVKERKTSSLIKCMCPAKIVARKTTKGWVYRTVDLQHNHPLHPSDWLIRFAKCHKSMTHQDKEFIRILHLGKIPPRRVMQIYSAMKLGYRGVGFDRRDVSNLKYVDKTGNRNKDIEACIKRFTSLQAKVPGFTYDFETDDTNAVRSIFWIDAMCRMNYKLYGEYVSFDTTFQTNVYNMPFAPIIGVNNHGNTVLFGVGLLKDERVDTFEWLFRTFVGAMGGKAPKCIITDQDKAMMKAIGDLNLLAETIHRFCLWHIIKKLLEKLASIAARKEGLSDDLRYVIKNSFTVEEFEEGWISVLEKYDVSSNKHLLDLWEIRTYWVPAYFMDCFFPFSSSTTRSESTNSMWKDYVDHTDMIQRFLDSYEIIQEKCLSVDQGSSVDTNNNGKLKGDADAAVGDAGITTDINEPLLMVGPTGGFNAAVDTAGSDNEQSSEVHTSQLTITQSQSVDGTETPTQAWQVEEQLAEERVKIDQKKAANKRKIAIDGVKKRLVLATTTEDSAEGDHDQHDDMDDQPAPLAVQFPRCDTQAAKQAKPRRHKKRRASTSTNPGPQQKRRRSSRLSKKGKEAVDTGHRRSDGDGSGDGHDPDYNVSSEEYDEHEHDDDVSPGATDDDRKGKKKCKSEAELAHYRKGFHKGAANRKSDHNNSDKTSKEHKYAIVVAGNTPDQQAGPSDTRAIKVGSHISDCEKLKQAMAIIQQVAQQPHDLYTSLDDDEQTKLNTEYVDYVKKMASLVWSSANGLKNYMEIEHARLASRVEQSMSAHNSTSVEMAQDKLIVDDAELPYGANDIDLQKCAGQSALKKHVSPDQLNGQFADDALIYDQIISAELMKEKGTETTTVDTKQSSEGNANPIIDDVVTDQGLKVENVAI